MGDNSALVNLGRIRRAGFCETVDTQVMFTDLFDAYRKARILP